MEAKHDVPLLQREAVLGLIATFVVIDKIRQWYTECVRERLQVLNSGVRGLTGTKLLQIAQGHRRATSVAHAIDDLLERHSPATGCCSLFEELVEATGKGVHGIC